VVPGAVAGPRLTPGTRAPNPATPDPAVPELAPAAAPAAARRLADDRRAATAVCPSRSAPTAHRVVAFAGQPAWLAVTPVRGARLLVEVTATVCGPAELSLTIPVR